MNNRLLQMPRWLAWLLGLGLGLGTGLGAGTLAAQPTNAPRQALVFRNGDLLFGSLAGIRPADGVLWRHDPLGEPFRLTPSGVSEIHLGQHAPAPAPGGTTCLVRLTNLDELEGEVESLDDSQLVLNTWYAGRVVLPRARLLTLTPLPGNLPVLFTGPTAMDGWTSGKVSLPAGEAGRWSFRDGAFYAVESASIARELPLPDLASLEFELSWKGALNLAIALYADYLHPVSLRNKETEPDFGGFYSLQLNTQSATLLVVKKQDPLKTLPQALLMGLSQKNRATIAIRVNKPQRTFSLLIDGVLAKQWVDTDPWAGSGGIVRFVHQGQGTLKLSNIRLLEWDGRFEERVANVDNKTSDVASLLNRDKASGTIRAIRQGKVTLASGSSTLDIPLARVQQIDFAADTAEKSQDTTSDVRVYFARRGSLTFQLEDWNDRKVIAKSGNFGRLEFDPRAFSRVQLLR